MEVVYKYRYKCKFSIELCQRNCSSPMGRFGGGWNWELGFQLGSNTLVINLLVLSIIFSVDKD